METNMTQKKKKKTNRKWFWRIVLALSGIGCAIILIVGIGFLILVNALANFPGYDSACGVEDSSVFESIAQVTLPDDYSNFSSSCGGMQGWWAEARFDINPDDLDEFLETTHIELPLTTNPLPSRIYVANASSIKATGNLLYGLYDTVG
jgi:hypothetical protein